MMSLAASSNATSFTETILNAREINIAMTHNAVHATDRLCSDLKFVVHQTGTNVCPFIFRWLQSTDMQRDSIMVLQSSSISTNFKSIHP